MATLPEGCALRRATATDYAAYAALCRATFVSTFAPFHDEAEMARHLAAAFPDERLRAELTAEDEVVLVVSAGEALVAYARLTRNSSPSCVIGSRPMEIARFYVASAWHGRGVAAPLMAAVVDEARGANCDVAWLGVWEHNSRALGFYLRQGFVTVGRQVYPFDGQPENDLVMALAL
ncbi:MAG: GNAT family N-acetyltransferase [Gemmatimonadetes bacterium]|nr:GNAT family N-acetyltransferase [Gemmatimonadota bacterium]